MTTVLDSLNSGLHRAFAADERVILLGEDVLDPYGGAFKVTRGLSTIYPHRVLTTPVSEAGIVGVGAGMALRGLLPVVEVMFGDFLTLCADQLVNHVAKFRWMYNDQVRVPLVVRTPMGGRRGYGPTHSQTLEKLFLGVPGLHILAPCALGDPTTDPGGLLERAILSDDEPVLFIENKLLYLLQMKDAHSLGDFSIQTWMPPPSSTSAAYAPTHTLALRDAPPPTLTIAAYGYMVELCLQAAIRLAYDFEVFTELVVPTLLAPFEVDPILASTRQTGRILVVEEGTLIMGWGAEVLAQVSESLGQTPHKARRLAAQHLPIPTSGPLEKAALPGVEAIVQAARTML
jgi:pyruvate/2-oxoglutarate/acetoin dehydrogenase E1 component